MASPGRLQRALPFATMTSNSTLNKRIRAPCAPDTTATAVAKIGERGPSSKGFACYSKMVRRVRNKHWRERAKADPTLMLCLHDNCSRPTRAPAMWRKTSPPIFRFSPDRLVSQRTANSNAGKHAVLALYDQSEPVPNSIGPFAASLPYLDTGDNVAQAIGIVPK
jgi:hypothetical protein